MMECWGRQKVLTLGEVRYNVKAEAFKIRETGLE